MLELIAIVASPVIAVFVAQLMVDRRERLRRRHQVFQSLWLTRVDHGSFGRLSGEHVRALNLIEIEFSKSKMDEFQAGDSASARVLEAWRAYLTALNNTPQRVIDDHSTPEAFEWFAAREALFLNLLFEMGTALGYPFDRQQIRASAYAPIGYLSADTEGAAVRAAIRELLDGERAIHITADRPNAPRPPTALADGTTQEERQPTNKPPSV